MDKLTEITIDDITEDVLLELNTMLHRFLGGTEKFASADFADSDNEVCVLELMDANDFLMAMIEFAAASDNFEESFYVNKSYILHEMNKGLENSMEAYDLEDLANDIGLTDAEKIFAKKQIGAQCFIFVTKDN